MTELNIEQERREFEARGLSNSKLYDMAFDAWLAAKRAAQGSAEPVGYLAIRDIDGLKDPRIASSGVVLTKYASPGRVAVYTAPPAPVSAEPDSYRIQHANGFREAPRSWSNPAPHRSLQEGEKLIKLYESAPPSTGAKDSDLALDLLATVFDAYENGTSCCEISGGIEGEYIGNAVRLDNETSKKCADLLNRLRPRAISEAKFSAETRIAP